MSWKDAQRKLNAFGYQLSADGIPGPKTYGALFSYMGARDTAAQFWAAAADYFPAFEIITPLRVAHFLAQSAEESGSFRYMTEIWGPTEAQDKYENNKALGNTEPGDGYKYRGRGIFELTGRANYSLYRNRIGVDIVSNPELAAQPNIALHIACLYWDDLQLNRYADEDNLLAVSNGINRGNPDSLKIPNGYLQRQAQLTRARAVLT